MNRNEPAKRTVSRETGWRKAGAVRILDVPRETRGSGKDFVSRETADELAFTFPALRDYNPAPSNSDQWTAYWLMERAWRVARILCVANQKGGVGKTTTAVNLAVALARSGGRALLIDLDPQCNATTALGGQPAARHALIQQRPLSESLAATQVSGLELLPGSRSFEDITRLATGDEYETNILRQHMSSSVRSFDFVLIDCPPSLGRLTETALAASNEVVMPIQCEYFAMEGLTQMIQVIRKVMREPPNELEFGGILLTMYDRWLELTHEVEAEVRDFFGEIVFDTVIPRDVAVSEAPSHGKSVMDYAPRARGARAYIELCMEVLDRD